MTNETVNRLTRAEEGALRVANVVLADIFNILPVEPLPLPPQLPAPRAS